MKEGAKTAMIVVSILLSMVAIYMCTRMLEDEAQPSGGTEKWVRLVGGLIWGFMNRASA